MTYLQGQYSRNEGAVKKESDVMVERRVILFKGMEEFVTSHSSKSIRFRLNIDVESASFGESGELARFLEK